ncbi:nicotinamidase [Brachyspira alvinipulli]|uniref:nicotinamidase n=1 Tax=Brachyspira alvinipulli TaxID=84379 RepID=UPI000484029E|nr:nicotinamidase [Brachyspira alvinipulli]
MSVKIPYESIVNEEYIGKEVNPINQQSICQLSQQYNAELSKGNINLLIVDPQRDFVDIKKGALAVNGAIEDIKKITRFIYSNMDRIANIYVTLDTHRYDSIFHPIMWKDALGNVVSPFTEVTLDKIESNEIIPVYDRDIQINYVRALEKQGSQNLMIWPYHCLHYTDGWLIEKQLSNMLLFFEMSKKVSVKKILKGQDAFTEMYGVLRAEVITENSMKYDNSWVYEIKNADDIYVCGEAKDYCVYETIKQFCEIYNNDKNIIGKINIMMNCCSAIGDNNVCEQRYHELSKKYGIKLINI